jgi:hypothetical protein
MSLTSKIQKAVDTAFIKVGDLRKVATVSQKSVTGWDIATGTPNETPKGFDVEVIMISETTSDKGVITADLIFKTTQLPVDMSSTFIIEGSTYRVVPPVEDNGFIVQLKAKKEQ